MGNTSSRVHDKQCTFCEQLGVSDIDGYIYQIRGRGKHDGKWVCTTCLMRKVVKMQK